MAAILYADESMIPDLGGYHSAELVFSGIPCGCCRETKEAASASGGMELLKRWISSSSFSVIVLSGFTSVAESVKENAVYWVSDHLSEPGTPLLIVISSGPWKEGRTCSSAEDIQKYLNNIK